MDNKYYVYGHYKSDGTVFYIGKGFGNRAHSTRARNKHWRHIVAKHGLRVGILADNLDENTAFRMEQDFIYIYGRRDLKTGPLVNMTDGGEGTSGIIRSDKTRAKMSAATMGNQRTLGLVHTVESRAKISAAKHTLVSAKGRLLGTTFERRNGKWQASIYIASKKKHIGYFLTEQLAHEAYLTAKSALNTEVRDDIAS